MSGAVIFDNDYLKIFIDSRDIYIETYKTGFPMEKLNAVFSEHPEIGITSYNTLRSSLKMAPSPAKKFAELKSKLQIDITNDELKATLVLNLPKAELELRNRERLIRDVADALKKAGVTYGIKREVLLGELQSGKQYVVAEGVPPVDGRDSVITMYELKENKPEVRENGRVDFYELSLINRVVVGAWLGERIEATQGVPGISVKGTPIRAANGKNFPLSYDRNTVQELSESDKTLLYSRTNGAVNYNNGKISVSNHLEIDGDVGVGTGNLKFDGYVTIKGTVADGYSVEATKDIEINAAMGVGNVRRITSTAGSIFIKGGVSSKGRTEIKAAKNLFTKFLDNVFVRSGGATHIGYYCINSEIYTKEMVLDSANGQIIGGCIKAEIRVSSPIIGSEIEKKTQIEVTGFSRSAMVEHFDGLIKLLGELKGEQQQLKLRLAELEKGRQLNQYQKKQHTDLLERLLEVRDSIKNLEEERKSVTGYLRARGDGEITVTKKIFPNCTLIIKRNIIEISQLTPATIYYVQDSEIKQV